MNGSLFDLTTFDPPPDLMSEQQRVQDRNTETRAGPNGEQYQVIPMPSRGSRWIQCPICHLVGTLPPDDPNPDDPGECPGCGVLAVWMEAIGD